MKYKIQNSFLLGQQKPANFSNWTNLVFTLAFFQRTCFLLFYPLPPVFIFFYLFNKNITWFYLFLPVSYYLFLTVFSVFICPYLFLTVLPVSIWFHLFLPFLPVFFWFYLFSTVLSVSNFLPVYIWFIYFYLFQGCGNCEASSQPVWSRIISSYSVC